MTATEIKTVARQAHRYAIASAQDRNAVVGYLHATYAVGLLDMLSDLGHSTAFLRGLRTRAGALQDRFGLVLFEAVPPLP